MKNENLTAASNLLGEATALFVANPSAGAYSAMSAAMLYYQVAVKTPNASRAEFNELVDSAVCKIAAVKNAR